MSEEDGGGYTPKQVCTNCIFSRKVDPLNIEGWYCPTCGSRLAAYIPEIDGDPPDEPRGPTR